MTKPNSKGYWRRHHRLQRSSAWWIGCEIVGPFGSWEAVIAAGERELRRRARVSASRAEYRRRRKTRARRASR